MAKRYYWLKLKENFFDDDTISWIEEQENGKEYCLFYLKLCLKSLKTDGVLIRTVGDLLIPYDAKKLAEFTRTDFDTVIVAMELFKKIGLVQVLENGEIYLSQLSEMVGSETDKAALMRKSRAKNMIGNNVTRALPICYTEIEKEKEIEIEIEIEGDKSLDICPDKPTSDIGAELGYGEISRKKSNKKSCKESTPTIESKKPARHKYGNYNNVLLSDADMEKLQNEFPYDWQQRIERLSEYMASTGKSYKSHLATIRSWARKDKPQKPSGYRNDSPAYQQSRQKAFTAEEIAEKKKSDEEAALYQKFVVDQLKRKAEDRQSFESWKAGRHELEA